MDGPPQDGTIDQSLSIAPPPQRLFLPGTPSAAGTPARQRYANSVSVTPMSGIPARRALGMSTPRRAPRTPLFARECLLNVQLTAIYCFFKLEAPLSHSQALRLLRLLGEGSLLTLIQPFQTLSLLPFLRELISLISSSISLIMSQESNRCSRYACQEPSWGYSLFPFFDTNCTAIKAWRL
jgi:hypothetical protein